MQEQQRTLRRIEFSPSETVTGKWLIVALAALGQAVVSLNWYGITVGLQEIGSALDASLSQQALLTAAFTLAFGILPILGGILIAKRGLRPALTASLVLLGIAAVISAMSPSYEILLLTRIVCGVGAGVFAGAAPAASNVLFNQHRNQALATGVTLAGFSLGIVLGLYVWTYVTAVVGWRWAIGIPGIFSLLTAGIIFTLTKKSVVGRAAHAAESSAGLRRTFSNRALWMYGIAFLGAYGAMVTASQLLTGYGLVRGFAEGDISLALLVFSVAGIPVSLVGGWVSDRLGKPIPVFIVGAVTVGPLVTLLAIVDSNWLWVLMLAISVASFGCWSPLFAIPSTIKGIVAEDFGAAIGLLLTLSAVGGFILPYGFGWIVELTNYSVGWISVGAISVGCSLVLLAGHRFRKPDDLCLAEPMQESYAAPDSSFAGMSETATEFEKRKRGYNG